jgi:hypothetical protein
MDVAPNDARAIEGQRLTAWAVLPGGTQIRLDFAGAGGRVHRIVLPFDALSGLLMTLPRMLQTALEVRFADGSRRIVQRLSAWQLEPLEGEDGVLLKLGTTDGLEVAFVLDDAHTETLGAAHLATPDDLTPSPIRRLN